MLSRTLLKFCLFSIFLHGALAIHVLSVGVLDAVHDSILVDVVSGKATTYPSNQNESAPSKIRVKQSNTRNESEPAATTAVATTTGAEAPSQLPTSADGALVTEGLRPLNLSEINQSIKRTPVAIEKNIEGQIKLKLLVDATGVVRRVTALNELGFGLDQVATEAAWRLRFIPAKIKSQSVSLETYYTVKFTIKHQ